MKKLHLLFYVIIFSFSVNSQSLTPIFTNAGSFTTINEGIRLQYVIGETVVGKLNSGEITLSQGYSYNTNLFVNIYEKDIPIQIKTWPNPVKDILNIKFSSNNEIYKYTLIDVNGNLILFGEFSSIKEFLNTKYLLPGLYVLRIFNERRVLSIKLIKT